MRFITALIMILGLGVSSYAENPRYDFGGGGGVVKLTGGDFYRFDWEESYAFTAGHWIDDRWRLSLQYSFFTLSNSTGADSVASFDGIANNTPLEFRANRLGLVARRLLLSPGRPINMAAGLGGGVMFWKMVDLADNTTFKVTGSKDELTDFSASELFFTGTVGFVIMPVSQVALNIEARADYMTHAGAEFAPEVKSSLDRWLLGAGAYLTFRFGGSSGGSSRVQTMRWVSDSAWAEPQTRPISAMTTGPADGDGDGVVDDVDRCLNTPRGVVVDQYGCPTDSDRDGVPDGSDDCPGTSPSARGKVDIHGCPIDSDFDGVPDYMDACPFNTVGAWVDENGCPTDADADGVPDGLDDCPYTLVGVDVDKYGCIDLAMFARPMVLNIDYLPGSFEIDPHTKERLKKLAGVLNFLPDFKVEIHGYTDNIGTEVANRNLSEKRAARVRDYLVSLGIASDRMKVFGRGETNFVASNDTAEGRAKNRRIELIFYR